MKISLQTLINYKNQLRDIILFPLKFLLIGGLTILLVILLIISSQAVYDLNNHIEKNQKLLTWIVQLSKQAYSNRHQLPAKRKNPTDSLLTIIDQKGKKGYWQAYPFEMKQQENDQVEISFAQINFNDLEKGIEEIWNENGVQVVEMNLQKLPEGNQVQVSMVLKRN